MKRPNFDVELLRKSHQETQKKMENISKNTPTKEGQLNIHGWFKSYVHWTQVNGKNTKGETIQVPETRMIVKADGTGSFPASININVQLKEMTEIPDNCVNDGDGFKVKMHITYTKEAEAFLLDNYQAFYNGALTNLRFPIGDFVSETGELKDTYWKKFNKKDLIEISVYDNEDSIFRSENDDGTPKVDPYTEIRFANCLSGSKIIMTDDYSIKDPVLRKKVPSEVISFNCKGQSTLSANNDPDFTGTERIHHLNDLDAHTLIPFANLVKGESLPNATSFEYVSDGYKTPDSSNKDYGVVVYAEYSKEEDLKKVYQKQVTYKDVIQWTKHQYNSKSSEEDLRKYYFCIATASKGEWKQWGIMNPEVYMSIRSNSILPVMLQVNWNVKDMLMDEYNIKGVENVLCIYRGYVREYDVDFIRGLPNPALGGIKISKSRVEQEFGKWKGIRQYDNTITINLTASAKDANPLHARGLNSPIISLGNGKCDPNGKNVPIPLNHGFSGDIFPILDVSDFYVLISRRLTKEEREAHAGESGKDGDAFLDAQIKADPDLQYWIYAYNTPCIPKKAAEPPVVDAKKTKVEEEEEVEEEVQDE